MAYYLFGVVSLLGVVSCVSSDVAPLGSGYEEVTYTHGSLSEPAAQRISLQYQNSHHGRIKIWPSLYGVSSVIKNDIAIFVGDEGYVRPGTGSVSTRPRLFFVNSSHCPMDVTDEVLWRWSKGSGQDFDTVVKSARIVYPKEKDAEVEFLFATGLHKDIVVRLDWAQIADIMREVKQSGIERKDSRWGTIYIEKEFNSKKQN